MYIRHFFIFSVTPDKPAYKHNYKNNYKNDTPCRKHHAKITILMIAEIKKSVGLDTSRKNQISRSSIELVEIVFVYLKKLTNFADYLHEFLLLSI
jgi:hypothetical protein